MTILIFSRLRLLVGLFWAGLAALGSSAGEVRVVSQTVGTDELLLALAEPEQIACLSHLAREPAFSAVAEEARAYPKLNRGDAETVLKYQPTLVLGADYSRIELLDRVEATGVRVVRITDYATLQDAFANLRMIAAELGPAAEARAERIIAESEARVARLAERLAGREPLNVIAPSTYGVIGGAQTTFQDMCDHAGAVNLASALGGLVGHQPPPVEQMLTWPVDRLVLSADSVDEALEPYAKLSPYRYMAAYRERRVALIAPYMLSSVSHHRIDGYEALARELHPEAFTEE
jgi:iron complex transport system substrate-binding protein